MCEGCTEIILDQKHVVRHAALCNLTKYLRTGIRQAAQMNQNDFVNVNELISIILKKTFIWKKNKTGEIKLNNRFFHEMAKNAAIDESGTYHEGLENIDESEVITDARHLRIVQDIHLDFEKRRKLELVSKACESDMERDAIYSLTIGEDTQSFADRHNLKYNSATQFKKRLIQKIKQRLKIENQQISVNQENNNG